MITILNLITEYYLEIISLILFILGLPFILGPFAVYFTQAHYANPSFLPISFDRLPADIKELFSYSIRALNNEGFEHVAYLYSCEHTINIHTYLSLLVHPNNKDSAIVSSIQCRDIHTTYVEFCTEFFDGKEFCTLNNGEPSVLRTYQQKQIYKFPEIKNPQSLYKIHRAIIKRHNLQHTTPKLPSPGKEVFELTHGMRRDFEKQVEFGYLYLTADGQWFKPTFKGAVLMTWKLVWPIGMIRRTQLVRKSRKLANDLAPELI
jgi:hypothetical protein